MGIQNLTRIHWILLGAFLGAALAFAWSGAAGNTESISQTDQRTFENEVVQKDPQQRPLISGIVVHPPIYSPVDQAEVNQVTYKRLATDKVSGRTDYFIKHWFVAKIPYRPVARGVPSANAGTMDVRTYLRELAKMPNNDFIRFREGWWLNRKNAVIAGSVAGVVIIGGIWPTLLWVMVAAGLAPKPAPREKSASLWRYKPKSPEKQTSRKRVITAEDEARLQSVADSYEKNLEGSGLGMTEAGADTSAPTPSPAPGKKSANLRPLENKKLDETKKPETEEDGELKYKEFYPVVVHHKKAEDEQKKPH